MRIRHVTLRIAPEMLAQMALQRAVAEAVLEAMPTTQLLLRAGGVPLAPRLGSSQVSVEVRGDGSAHKPVLNIPLPLGVRPADITAHATCTMDLMLIADLEIEVEPPGRRKGVWEGAVVESVTIPVTSSVEPVGRAG